MKVALLTDGIYPYVIGGMQRHSYYLAKYLAKNRVHVDLYFFQNNDFDPEEIGPIFTDDELEFIELHKLEFPKLDPLPGHYLRESYQYSVEIFEQIKDHLHRYDFIYAKGFSAWKLIKEKRNGLTCPPIGVKFHGYEMFQKAPSFRVKMEHMLLRRPVLFNSINADYVFSYGGKITEIIKRIGVAPQKIVEIPSGIQENWIKDVQEEVSELKQTIATSHQSTHYQAINGKAQTQSNVIVAEPKANEKPSSDFNLADFRTQNRREQNQLFREGLKEKYPSPRSITKFLFIGRFERRKGVEELSEAIRQLSILESFEFHFVGPIPEAVQINHANVIYHGQLTDSKKMREVLHRCDVLVTPSHSEGMPNVILEGMASGLAIIATDVGAVNIMVGNRNGWLIEAGNVEELKLVMKEAIDMPGEKLEALKENSISSIRENFLWSNVIKRTINELTLCAQQGKHKDHDTERSTLEKLRRAPVFGISKMPKKELGLMQFEGDNGK